MKIWLHGPAAMGTCLGALATPTATPTASQALALLVLVAPGRSARLRRLAGRSRRVRSHRIAPERRARSRRRAGQRAGPWGCAAVRNVLKTGNLSIRRRDGLLNHIKERRLHSRPRLVAQAGVKSRSPKGRAAARGLDARLRYQHASCQRKSFMQKFR
jgi:hypothetical protein